MGREIQSLGPAHTVDVGGSATGVRRAQWTVYDDVGLQLRSAGGYATGGSWDAFTLVNPVSIQAVTHRGNPLETIQATRASTSGKLLPSDSFAQSTYKRWTTYQYSLCCLLASERLYHAIPASGSGDEGTNYDQTAYAYDSAKRRIRRTSPGGTITRWVYDQRSNIIGIYVGTDDTGATPTDPTGGGAQGNNMKLIDAKQFDQGSDGGDNNLTQLTQPVNGSTQRVTNYAYDWRNRQIEVQGELDYFQKTTYDNLNRAIQVDGHIGSAAGQLLSRSQSLYDPLGRNFRSILWGVDPDTGSVTYPLTTNHWFDPTGNAAKSHGPGSDQFTKTVYDSLNRAVVRYEAYGDDSTYNDALSITGNVVLEQTETVYDDADSVIATIIRQRYHDAPAAQTGPLGNPGSAPKARVTYAAEYADPLGRSIASADWGTADGSGWSRPATIPASSDTILVSRTGYHDAGEAFQVIDPAGKEDRTEFDAAGRRSELVENYVDSSSGGSSGNGCAPSDDENVTTQFTYTPDGNLGEQKVINAETGDQITKYIYGTTLSDSEIASSQLLRRIEYPDSTGPTDSVRYSYNRQSDTIGLEDQNGNVHAYDYDQRGRRTQDRVTTLGSGVDGAVRRIETAYTPLDRVEKITSYDAPGVGSGNVVNQVQFKYNAFGQSIDTLQNTSGAVNPSTSPSVQSAYADGSANTIRPLSLTYPSGRQIRLDYGSSGSIDAAVGRVVRLIDPGGSIHLAVYQYLGLGTVVQQENNQNNVQFTLIDRSMSIDPDTGDIYSGLDRFGRVKDVVWHDPNEESAHGLSRVLYGYDRASNRLWRENPSDSSRRYDWLYSYDGLHRLHTAERGELNSGHTAITSPQFGQCWTLDPTGNWEGFRQDDNGNGTWNLIQARTANPVNEITDIDNTTGNAWATPAYDANGNMSSLPRPDLGTDKAMDGTWDAWNRLVKLVDPDTSHTLLTLAYDGRNYRVKTGRYSSGTLDKTIHHYFTDAWQCVEQRVDSSSDPERQHVWGLRYIDDLVLRDRDTTGNGTLDERLYAMSDANWNVTGVVDTSGVVQERIEYTPYGRPQFLAANFTPRSGSDFDWRTSYTGREWESAVWLYDFRHRWYIPLLGVFASRDPVRSAYESAATYAYVDSDPAGQVDPYGDVPIMCTCRRRGFWTYEVATNCTGLATTCCQAACGGGYWSFTGKWEIVGAAYYDDSAEREFRAAMVDITLCCIPLPPIVGVGGRLGWIATKNATRFVRSTVGRLAPKAGGAIKPSPGVTVRKVGNYFIKEVDPNASALARWHGERSLRFQSEALTKLGDMAPRHLLKNRKLITCDAGTYTPGNFWRTWAKGSWRLRTPVNDIRRRNIGANGLIFDPAIDPLVRPLYWTAGVRVVGAAVWGIYQLLDGDDE